MSKNRKAQDQIHPKLVRRVIMYIVFISILAAFSIQSLNTVYANANSGVNQPTTKDFFATLLLWLVIYAIRGIVLFIPRLISRFIRKIQFKGWIYGGIVLASPVELILILGLLNYVFSASNQTSAMSSGSWSALGLVIPLSVSCMLQIVGMATGSAISFAYSKNRSKS
jgi:hypothetical protein